MTIFDRLKGLFSPEPTPTRRVQLDESENEFLVGTTSLNTSEFDRPSYSRDEILTRCLDAWRYNPIARRVTEIISQYVVGAGFAVTSSDAKTDSFLQEFWNHRFNHMNSRLIELCDELTRSGNLFILISTDAGGMSYLRLIPASQVDEISTKENDLEQELAYTLKAEAFKDPVIYPAYSPEFDLVSSPVVIHYAINKPAGAS